MTSEDKQVLTEKIRTIGVYLILAIIPALIYISYYSVPKKIGVMLVSVFVFIFGTIWGLTRTDSLRINKDTGIVLIISAAILVLAFFLIDTFISETIHEGLLFLLVSVWALLTIFCVSITLNQTWNQKV